MPSFGLMADISGPLTYVFYPQDTLKVKNLGNENNFS